MDDKEKLEYGNKKKLEGEYEALIKLQEGWFRTKELPMMSLDVANTIVVQNIHTRLKQLREMIK